MTPKSTILSRHKLTRSIASGATVIVLAGGGYAIAESGSSSGSARAATAASPSVPRGQLAAGSGESNARSGPAAGGASGTVDSVSASGFTISTSAGQKVTVNKASSTTYQKGTSSTSASAIAEGENVLVLGTTSGTTITASQVIRATDRRRRICDFHDGRGGPLQARCTVNVKAGRSDPSELQSGVGDDRWWNGSE